MTDGKKFETFQYFFEAYFNMSARYDDLEEVLRDYLKNERRLDVRALIVEFTLLLEEENWNTFRSLLEKYGKRRPPKQKLEWMLGIMKQYLLPDAQ